MTEALVSIEELQARLSFTMDPDDEREATGALEDLSDAARYYGLDTWTIPARAPRTVKNLITRAAVRHMKNYEGYTSSRAGDEAVAWTDRGEDAGSATFTETEKKLLRGHGGNRNSGLHSVQQVAYGSGPPTVVGLVLDEGSNEPIQMFASEDPW